MSERTESRSEWERQGVVVYLGIALVFFPSFSRIWFFFFLFRIYNFVSLWVV